MSSSSSSSSSIPIVLVCTGNYQEYIETCVKQLLLFENKNIVLILDAAFSHHITGHKRFKGITIVTTESLSQKRIKEFNQSTHLDSGFRGGFWRHCSSRFIYILEYMIQANIQNCFHLENDNMVYANLAKLFRDYDKGVSWICKDNPTRCIPSIMFLNRSQLADYLEKRNNNDNDMYTWGSCDNKNVKLLPICAEGADEKTDYVFDAAAIGQYLFGADPRNNFAGPGMVNTDCTFVRYDKYKLEWRFNEKTKLWYPVLIDKGKAIPIINLHMHCKNLRLAYSKEPASNSFISKK